MNLKDKLSHKIFQTVSEVAAREGKSTFVIGGFVRDLILNRPSKDIDFVVLGDGLLFAEKVVIKYVNNASDAVMAIFPVTLNPSGVNPNIFKKKIKKNTIIIY